ncbi:PREDICTED: uncharacterized protein LOC104592812 [Nelumbo nucifera]|uniref:Uncharacterized protein n=2 Tax=Nelumbo nucifera TaxID=4432 RepID=A0A822YIZ0_NELNU|nr:PREDICTED: uncharacterized protein LOC104592812 [Nelumbo nucifera]DAD34164.1 TPA_asm: hypothetical protein HUJ06_004804 [Nelumbo nucifera]
MFAAMDPRVVFLLLVSFFTPLLSLKVHPAKPAAKITVMGVVYCDICSSNIFSRQSYFLPDVEVHMDCKFNANSQTTSERLSFSVNRTTDRFGVYSLEIPSVDGFECANGPAIESVCQASLIGSSSSSCNVPGLRKTSDQMAIISRQVNLCVYSLGALNYRPRKRNITLCGKYK